MLTHAYFILHFKEAYTFKGNSNSEQQKETKKFKSVKNNNAYYLNLL